MKHLRKEEIINPKFNLKFINIKNLTMKLKLTVLMFLCFVKISFSQISVVQGGALGAKEFSKEISLYKAKSFVISEIIGQHSSGMIEFKIDPLAASNSGEITSLVYRCESLHKEGLILGFYGDRWNDAGVIYKSYAFKNLPVEDAREFIDRIEQVYDSAFKFMQADNDNNNVYFSFEGIGILMYSTSPGIKLRIYWDNFDSEWQWSEFAKTEKRLNKKLK